MKMKKESNQKAKQSIAISKEKDLISIKVKLTATLEKEESGIYCVHCPALGIASQGANMRAAKKNIAEAVELFIESCMARNVLNEVLAKRGFQLTQQKAVRKKPSKPRTEINAGATFINVPAEIPIAEWPMGAVA